MLGGLILHFQAEYEEDARSRVSRQWMVALGIEACMGAAREAASVLLPKPKSSHTADITAGMRLACSMCTPALMPA